MDWIALYGESMRPFLRSGDGVAVEWLTESFPRRPDVGDLVVGRAPEGDWILHRVVERPTGAETRWGTKGDASLAREAFSESELWGIVVAYRRGTHGVPKSWRRSRVDRWIAHFSLQTLSASRGYAAFCRRMVRGLGWLRRLHA